MKILIIDDSKTNTQIIKAFTKKWLEENSIKNSKVNIHIAYDRSFR